MNILKIIFSLAILIIGSSPSLAAGKAKVDVTAKKLDADRVEFSFKTVAGDGLKINAEGPWKLEIKDAGSVTFEKKEMKRADWKESDAAFIQTGKAKPKTSSSNISYKLTAFVCTQDKGQCFREVIEGKTDVKW